MIAIVNEQISIGNSSKFVRCNSNTFGHIGQLDGRRTYTCVIIERKLGKIDCPRTDGLCLRASLDSFGKLSFG